MNGFRICIGVFLMLFCASSCSKNELPVAIFEITPRLGHYSQMFTFDASNSRDVESREHELEVRWDFDGDGNWDTDWSSEKIATFYYSEKAIYTAIMQIRDGNGNITEGRRVVEATLLNLKGVLVDVRDGNDYKTVLIDSIWWMAEDLHHGKWISMWERAEQKDDGFVQRYGATDFEDLDVKSGYYNYGEAMDYNFYEKATGICPPGWYIPDNDEWISLVEHVGDGKDPAIFLSVIGDEGVNLAFTGRRYIGWGQSVQDFGGLYWSSTGSFQMEPYGISFFYYPKDTSELRPIRLEPGDSLHTIYFHDYALPLRCVKKNER